MDKKIGRPRKFDGKAKTAQVKLSEETYQAFSDFCFANGKKVSDVLFDYVTNLVAANKNFIENFRRNQNLVNNATFPSPPSNISFDTQFRGDDWMRVRTLFTSMRTFNFGTDVNPAMHGLCRMFVDLIDICERDEKNGFAHSSYRFEDSDGYRDDGHERMRSYALTIENLLHGELADGDWHAAITHDLNSLGFSRHGLRAAINYVLTHDSPTKDSIEYYLEKNISNFTPESFFISEPITPSTPPPESKPETPKKPARTSKKSTPKKSASKKKAVDAAESVTGDNDAVKVGGGNENS